MDIYNGLDQTGSWLNFQGKFSAKKLKRKSKRVSISIPTVDFIADIRSLDDAITKLKYTEKMLKTHFDTLFFTMAPKKRSLFIRLIKLLKNILDFITGEYLLKIPVSKEFSIFRRKLHEMERNIKERETSAILVSEISELTGIVKETLYSIENY